MLLKQLSNMRSCRDGTTTTRYNVSGVVSKKSVTDAIRSVYVVVRRSAMSYKIGHLPAVMRPCCSTVSDSVEPAIYSHSIVKNYLQFVPVCPICIRSQKMPRIHGVKSRSRISGRGRALSWVTVSQGTLFRAASRLYG